MFSSTLAIHMAGQHSLFIALYLPFIPKLLKRVCVLSSELGSQCFIQWESHQKFDKCLLNTELVGKCELQWGSFCLLRYFCLHHSSLINKVPYLISRIPIFLICEYFTFFSESKLYDTFEEPLSQSLPVCVHSVHFSSSPPFRSVCC